MLNYDKFVCTCCMYITYNISNYNRHLKTTKHYKKDLLHNMVEKSKNDLLHNIKESEKDSNDYKKDLLDNMVEESKNDLLHNIKESEKDSNDYKKDLLDNMVEEFKNDLLHNIKESEKDSNDYKKDLLDNMVGESKNDLLHKYRCIKCNYETIISSNYYRHMRTKKHIKNERDNKEKIYECIKCKFKSKYKSNYKRHLLSKKHLRNINNIKESCSPINFNEFIKLIKSDVNDIETIISVGIEKYITNQLKYIYNSINIKPLYCSDLKRKNFMIYNKNIWTIVNKDILQIITEKIQKNILKKLNKWKKENKFKYSLERLNEKYIYIVNICSENLINNKNLIKDICRLLKN